MTDQTRSRGARDAEDFDVIIAGAGFSGLYLLHRLRDQLGLKVAVFEAGSSVGGTWYWNRYPGARCDSTSQVYQFWFSEEVLDEWRWKERFSTQGQMLEYFEFVVDRCDLRRDIRFEARVNSATFDEEARQWTVTTEQGATVRGRYFISAVGSLTEPLTPDIPGLETFGGTQYHTSRWPHEAIDFSGQRVGVLGTGATGIQVVQTLAPQVEHLTVFQRTPNYVIPMRNAMLGELDWQSFQQNRERIRQLTEHSSYGFDYDNEGELAQDWDAATMEAELEKLWADGSLRFWNGSYADALLPGRFNDFISDFARRKMRAAIKDPAKAALAVPDYPFAAKRVPLEKGYLDALNQSNVDLVCLRKTPLQHFTPEGVSTAEQDYPLDAMIFATGFDAVTGALLAMNIRGGQGQLLKDVWAGGARAYLGTQTPGFPNFFMVSGPTAPSAAFCNVPACLYDQIDFITSCIEHMQNRGLSRIEATPAAEDAWIEHVNEEVEQTVLVGLDSWWMGTNVPGKQRQVLSYIGGRLAFREHCQNSARDGYAGFDLRQ
ncbi:MAG: flavin-containing monooxygenase [Parahaliea sp.]